MARLYGRYLRSSAYSMGAAKSEFGRELFAVGADLAESEKKSKYSSQIAQANAQKIRSLDGLSQWMHENRDDPDRYEDYFNKEFWPQYEKDVTAGLKGTALRDIKNDLVVEKEDILTGIREQRRDQQVKNNIVNTNALIDEHEKPRAYDNIHELSMSLTSFADATRIAMDSGDVPELQTPEQHTELFERMSSFEVKNYILQHPDKEPGDEYYISHPNEFANDFGFSSAFRGKLFGPDEIVDLKKEYNNNLKINQVDLAAKAEAREIEISNDIVKMTDTSIPPEQKLSPSEIKTKIIQSANMFTDASQVRELQHFLDSQINRSDNEATEEQKLKSLDKIYDAIEKNDRALARKELYANSWMFTTGKNSEILKDIRDIGEVSVDPILKDALSKEGAFTTKLRSISEISTPEEIAQIEVDSMNRREQIRQYFKNNSDATIEQKLGAVQNILVPAKEKAAKNITEKWYEKLFGPNVSLRELSKGSYRKSIRQMKKEYKGMGETRTYEGKEYTVGEIYIINGRRIKIDGFTEDGIPTGVEVE